MRLVYDHELLAANRNHQQAPEGTSPGATFLFASLSEGSLSLK